MTSKQLIERRTVLKGIVGGTALTTIPVGSVVADDHLISVSPTSVSLEPEETVDVTVEIQGPPFGRTDIEVRDAPAEPTNFQLSDRGDTQTVTLGPVEEATTATFYASLPRGDEQTVTVDIDVEDPLPAYLRNLATERGGMFAQFDDGSRQAFGASTTFEDLFGDLAEIEDGTDGLVAWVVDSVDAVATSEADGAITTLGFSETNEIGDTGYYARAATGFGTPQPWQGNYELVTLEATDDGIRTIWESVD